MEIAELVKLVVILRKKCPWDRQQTLKSLKNNLVEEAYELVEAIEADNFMAIKEEIGDILFLGIFLARVLEEEKGFPLKKLLGQTIKKYKHKHPHVFKKKQLSSPEAVLRFWNRNKKDTFRGIPKTLPALLAAKIIQERTAKLGFDWNSHHGPLKKIAEEIRELKQSINSKHVFEEFGDLLFACVNLARHLNLDAEDALRYANKKFIKRFKKIKAVLKSRNKKIEQTTLPEMDRIWDEIKK